MDFSAASLISGLVIGSIGMALLLFGKKQGHVPALIAGVVMSGETFVIHSVAVQWMVAALCIAGVYLVSRRGGSW
ncbi:MAG TPA: hypothetical protein VK176_13400 [Phycisphaerales bacterium]|nr:hypothetical protein [Phycisphaerales bacterium]